MSDHECVFLCEKLGMLFNAHEGKVTVIGLDSVQYKQAAHTVMHVTPMKTAAEEDNEIEDNQKYNGVITLVPTAAAGVSSSPQQEASSGVVDGKESPSSPGGSEKMEKKESFQMTAAEVLSAIANFEDDPEESREETNEVAETNNPVENTDQPSGVADGYASQGFAEVGFKSTPFLPFYVSIIIMPLLLRTWWHQTLMRTSSRR